MKRFKSQNNIRKKTGTQKIDEIFLKLSMNES